MPLLFNYNVVMGSVKLSWWSASTFTYNESLLHFSLLQLNNEPIFHLQYNGRLRLDALPFHHLHIEVPHSCSNDSLHLHKCNVLAEAHPRASIEGQELVRWYVPQVVVII